MQKKRTMVFMLILLLTFVWGMFTATPASAATHRATTPTIASADVFCHYTVTATAGLNVRSGPGITFPIKYILSFQHIVTAYQDHVQFGPGPNGTTIDWRQLGGFPMALPGF
jgi:hypothetical protein